MKKFRIRGALGGGFGGCKNQEWEVIEAENEEAACDQAYQLAVDEYERYEGLHGLQTIDDIMEEYVCDEQEAEEIYIEERESWLDYEVEEVK